jgi:hypothetical protein
MPGVRRQDTANKIQESIWNVQSFYGIFKMATGEKWKRDKGITEAIRRLGYSGREQLII